MKSLWFDDLEVGMADDYGSHLFEADAIIAFAKKYTKLFYFDNKKPKNKKKS